MTDIPAVRAWLQPARDNRGHCIFAALVDDCPFCGGTHVHAGGEDPNGFEAFGERYSHCWPGGRYKIEMVQPIQDREPPVVVRARVTHDFQRGFGDRETALVVDICPRCGEGPHYFTFGDLSETRGHPVRNLYEASGWATPRCPGYHLEIAEEDLPDPLELFAEEGGER